MSTRRLAWPAALWAALAAASALAAPEGFAVMGDRIKEFPPPQGFAEVPSTDKRLPPPPAAGDLAAGFMLYSRDAARSVRRDSAPELNEITTELTAFAAPGEYEPWTFCVYALRDLAGVTVAVGPLQGEGGAVIPADHLDLRALNYVWRKAEGASYAWEPGFLEHRDSVAIPRETSQRWWLTVKVPDDARPGVYRARIEVTAGGKTRELTALLRVLPFALENAPYMGSMLAPSLQMYGDVFGKDLLHEKLVDLREHGHADAFGYFVFAPKFNGGPAEDPLLDFDTPSGAEYYSCNQVVAALRKAGVWGPLYVEQMGRIYAGYAGRYGKDKWGTALTAMVRKTHAYAQANGWPPLHINYGDEPAHSASQLKRCREIFRLVAEGGGSPSCYLNGNYTGIQDDVMFWPHMKVITTNYFNEPMLERLRLRRQRLWLYNVGLGRFEHGWQCIATGAELVTHYDYQTWAAPDKGAFKYCAAAADETTMKPIPSEAWENAREGVDDGRYFATLLAWIGRARASCAPDAMRAAQRAEKALGDWLARVPLDRGELIGWQSKLSFTASDLGRMRWRMARHVLDIREAMKPFEDEPWFK